MIIVPRTAIFGVVNGLIHEMMTDETAEDTVSKVATTSGPQVTTPTFFALVTSSGAPGAPLTAGELVIEINTDPRADGVWSTIATFDLTSIDVGGDSNSGIQEEDDVPWASGVAYRGRISEGVTGGSVTLQMSTGMQ